MLMSGTLSRAGLFVVGASLLTGLLAGLFAWHVSGSPQAHPDFAMVWTAAQQPRPYDQARLNEVLGWGARLEAAFAYPPTYLAILAPLTLLPLRVALAVWAAASGVAMGLASRSRWSPALLLLPPVLWALPGGQTSVMLGSLSLGAVLLLREPRLAGALLGIAVGIKPQLVLVLPFALLIDRRWAALLWAAATFLLIAIASGVIFGPLLWLDWVRALPGFLNKLELNPYWRANEIAFGLPVWLRVLALLLGAMLSARALRSDHPVEAFVIAVGASIIGAAHAMAYEFAMFAPALPALLARRRWCAPAAILFFLMPVLIWAGLPAFPWRVLAVLALVLAAAVDAGTIPATAATRRTNATGERP